MNNLFKDIDNLNLIAKISDNLNDGVNIVDKNGILVYVNKKSADYAESSVDNMCGRHIREFYCDAAALEVLKTKRPIKEKKLVLVHTKKYAVSSYPIINSDGELVGAYSIFKDIQEVENLNRTLKYLELQLGLSSDVNDISNVIGGNASLKDVIKKAQKTVGSLGGPRHCIITGESGTGKTMLANLIYNYAKKVGVIDKKAPFIEINCAQFTNPDIAAVEIFGSENGAYTGAKKKRGLFEQADGGILFLDEAHALESYQNLLLKAIESGKIRRIGGTSEIDIDVIIIAASTKNLKDVFLPELYQRLAQYELHMPSLAERNTSEKLELLNCFIKKYEDMVKKLHNIDINISFTESATKKLINANYPRNIRQFRDVINYCIDDASPLLEDISAGGSIEIVIDESYIPFGLNNNPPMNNQSCDFKSPIHDYKTALDNDGLELVKKLRSNGLGARKISKELKNHGYDIEFYRISYILKSLTK